MPVVSPLSSFVVPSRGSFQLTGMGAKGTRFIKEVLRRGTYVHPDGTWDRPLNVDDDYLRRVQHNTEVAISRGIEIPIPNTHLDGPEDNVGYIYRAFLDVPEDDSSSLALFVEGEVPNPEVSPKIGVTIRKVSAMLSPLGDGQWIPDGDRLMHVCLTNYPVASKQGNFIPIAASMFSVSKSKAVPVVQGEWVHVPLFVAQKKDSTMQKLSQHLSEKARSLGLSVAETGEIDESFVEKLLSMASQPPPVRESASALPMGAPGAIRALSVDASLPNSYFVPYRKAKAISAEAEAAMEMGAGKLTQDGAEAYKTLLSLDYAFTLDESGAAQSVEVGSLVRKILSSIPSGSAVPVAPRGEPLPLKEKSKEFEQAQETERTVDRMLGYIKPKKPSV